MVATARVCVTGLGIEIPAIASTHDLIERVLAHQLISSSDTQPPIAGSRYKDYATKLALLSAESALLDAKLPVKASEQVSAHKFGVIVSSNLGNLETVCRVDEIIRLRHAKHTSPMDFPNLSSNIVSSSVAIRFGLKGINLMVCNGATSGIDALHLAANVIRAGRARRMLVVGVEPADQTASSLMNNTLRQAVSGAVVVESEMAAQERQATIYGWLGKGDYGFNQAAIEESVRAATEASRHLVSLWLGPNNNNDTLATQMAALRPEVLPNLKETLDLSASLGETYGALGILQCIVACFWLKDYDKPAALITNGAAWGDPAVSLMIQRQPLH
ncbi:MAG: beta-ketoacyl synthase N-terminal-like domain-containing protein [Cyanobacteria bacterium P01_H01_bin.105]